MRPLLTIPAAFALAACASADTRYPSLALRPFETEAPAPDTTTPTPPAVPNQPPTSPANLAALRAKAESAHAGFLRVQTDAARIARAAAGQSVESDARAAALVAMADLAAQRGATAAVLADLDLLAAENAVNLASSAPVEAARDDIARLVAAQDAAMARLWEVIGT